ncbi:HPF/RaiA family ribosome-associated protein [Dactylosporangium sp. NPDC049525]|uniref:HPF/RaiA family ribosome-associated protein n=1 Tax=Dactylosporangium sp. NPDC049525 TaxID=3154730 RepID=UPI003435FD35
MSRSATSTPATVEDCLRVGAGFSLGDRAWIAEQFATLDTRLAAFPVDATELEVSVKDRAARGQKVTLECWIAGQQKIVTTSAEEDLHAALNDVRDDLRRRLNDAKTRQEPRNNRHLRDSTITDVISPELTPSLDESEPAAAAPSGDEGSPRGA